MFVTQDLTCMAVFVENGMCKSLQSCEKTSFLRTSAPTPSCISPHEGITCATLKFMKYTPRQAILDLQHAH